MRYLIQHSDTFWTGDRFSPHIGEAMRFKYERAIRMKASLQDRFSLRLHLIEAPNIIRLEDD